MKRSRERATLALSLSLSFDSVDNLVPIGRCSTLRPVLFNCHFHTTIGERVARPSTIGRSLNSDVGDKSCGTHRLLRVEQQPARRPASFDFFRHRFAACFITHASHVPPFRGGGGLHRCFGFVASPTQPRRRRTYNSSMTTTNKRRDASAGSLSLSLSPPTTTKHAAG